MPDTYTETDENTITFDSGMVGGEEVQFVINYAETSVNFSNGVGDAIANATEAAAVLGDYIVFTDVSDSDNMKKIELTNLKALLVPSASTSVAGILEIATDAEALAKTAADKALVPSNLAAIGATTSFAGLVELATNSETETGTATDKATTPAGVAAAIAASAGSGSSVTAFVNFNGASENDSSGVSSVTVLSDSDGTEYRVNFSPSMSNTDYAVLASCQHNLGNENVHYTSKSTSSVKVYQVKDTTQYSSGEGGRLRSSTDFSVAILTA
jgi:hypothetical protein